MKNNLTLIIISGAIFMGVILGLSDYARVRNANMPMFMLLLKNEGNQNFYYGFGYKYIRTSNTNFDDISNDVKDEFGLWFYTKEIEIKEKEYVYAFNIEKNNRTDFNFYFEDENGFKYYTAGIKSIQINDGSLNEFKNVIKNKKLTMDEILKNFTLEKFYSNNNTIYKINNSISNEDIKILQDKNNKKYYIGTKNINFDNLVYEKIINKEFQVLNLENTKTNDYVFVTLKDNMLDEVHTVKLLYKDYVLKENSNYEFVFIEENTNDGSIASIFENSKLKEIKLVEER